MSVGIGSRIEGKVHYVWRAVRVTWGSDVVVSVVGYAVEIFLLWTMMTYALIAMFTLARVVNALIEEKKVIVALLLGIIMMIVVMVLYYLPVKVGFVMFVNGVLATLVVFELKRIVYSLYVVSHYGIEDSGEGSVQG